MRTPCQPAVGAQDSGNAAFLDIAGKNEMPVGRQECARAVNFAGVFTPD